ncbi:MAG: tRNA (adenosine(37)-N6)-threonylcarbamoyltransferase complex transferase subunit TsaD [Bacteroidetes bacterium]|nr:tRNA (adenosine(37)-N6)-threonylcarbamoyltransferase complex transferase subunit TsaD [Bacteroidota bacterium]
MSHRKPEAKSQKPVLILGIESSCDETSAAVIKECNVLSNLIADQKIHELYGGVVPELASRAHQKNIVPVVDQALKESGIKKEELSAIAFTRGPGLIGSLLVGSSFAKAMALALDIPLIEVNHMQAHVLAHFTAPALPSPLGRKILQIIPGGEDLGGTTPSFPFLCLTVSGGHTQIVLVKDYLDMEVIGETIDDAAGEAFDKAAKILGLPYPGGPLIDKFAQTGNPHAFKFSEPNIPELNFSFSGLKTSILYFVRDKVKKDKNFIKKNLNDLCASIQHTIVKILMDKIILASKQLTPLLKGEVGRGPHIAISGGVSANSGLRNALIETGKKLGWNTHIPSFEYCTDNAAMIAIAGYYKYLKREFADQSIGASARYKL